MLPHTLGIAYPTVLACTLKCYPSGKIFFFYVVSLIILFWVYFIYMNSSNSEGSVHRISYVLEILRLIVCPLIIGSCTFSLTSNCSKQLKSFQSMFSDVIKVKLINVSLFRKIYFRFWFLSYCLQYCSWQESPLSLGPSFNSLWGDSYSNNEEEGATA